MSLEQFKRGVDEVAQDTVSTVVERFQTFYQELNKETLSIDMLSSLYAGDVCFEDSLHAIDGIDDMFDYFENLYSNIRNISFEFHDSAINEDVAFLTWTMHYTHSLINRGKPVEVEGASRLVVDNGLVVAHRDYFDGGQMLYEQLPGLGLVIRKLKARLA